MGSFLQTRESHTSTSHKPRYYTTTSKPTSPWDEDTRHVDDFVNIHILVFFTKYNSILWSP